MKRENPFSKINLNSIDLVKRRQPHTEERKKKISNALKEVVKRKAEEGSPYGFQGRKHTNASRKLMATIKKGTRHSEKTTAKISATMRKRAEEKARKAALAARPDFTGVCCCVGNGNKEQETEAGVSQSETSSSFSLLTGKGIYNYGLTEEGESLEHGN